MTEAARKRTLYVVLAGAVIFGVYNFSQPSKRYVPGPTTPSELEPAVTAPAAPTQPPINIAAIQKAGWGRDPFKWDSRPQPQHRVAPAASQPQQVPGWRLSAIVFSNSLPLAIINAKTVKVGDVVDGAKVVRIDQKKVTLLYNGSNIEIKMNKG